MDEMRMPWLIPSLERATHAVALWIERSLDDRQLTQAEAHVLGYLAHLQQCSINELHASFGHKRSTLTSVLDRLEQRRLVQRGPHPTSRRSVMVHLTDEGRQVAERVSTTLCELEDAIIARAGRDDAAAFLRLLTAIEEVIS